MPVEVDDVEASFKYFALDSTASQVAAKEAYRRYVKEFHPDTFPSGSDQQKMAAEKMVQAVAHYEKLKKFFEQYPEGKPLEGGEQRQEPHDDSDWQAWESRRREQFDDELKQWKAKQEALEKEKATTRESFRRGKLVNYVQVGLIVITALLWMGWFSANEKLDRQAAGPDPYKDAELYDLQTHGTSRGANALCDDEIHRYWEAKRQKYRESKGVEGKKGDQSTNGILLLLWTGGVCWFLFSGGQKQRVDDYLAGANK